MIKRKGIDYPTRTFELETTSGFRMEVTISTESLENVLDFENNERDEKIDEVIYFYVPDKVIDLPAEEICEKHLDEKVILIEEL